ncbi:MAG: hypothetical protein JXA33_05945 [Anaerolineae bacterium]|nr:hypothetical protein [Anaerolineae bacterium]
MWEDSIIVEIRQAREVYAKKHGYDLRTIYQSLKAREKSEEGKKVSFPPKLISTIEQGVEQLRPTNLAGVG